MDLYLDAHFYSTFFIVHCMHLSVCDICVMPKCRHLLLMAIVVIIYNDDSISGVSKVFGARGRSNELCAPSIPSPSKVGVWI